jgi:O-antigen ligase
MKTMVASLREGFTAGSTIDRWIWGTLVVFVLSMMLSTAMVQASAVVLVGFWVSTLIRLRTVRVRRTAFDIPVIAFAGARIISVFTAVDVGTSIRALTAEVFFYSTFFALTDLLGGLSRERVRVLLQLAFIAAGIVAIIGITNVVVMHHPRAASVTSGYFSLGLYLTALCSVALFLGRDPSFFPSRAWWGVLCLLLSTGVLLTLNRTHWVALGLTMLVAGLLRERKALVVAVVLAAVAVFAVPVLQVRFFQLLHLSSNLSDRDTLWKGGMMLAGAHPLTGFGPRSFRAIFPLFSELADKGVGGWHNDYLQIYIESGIIGLTALLSIVVSVYVRGVRASKRTAQRNLCIGLLLGLSVFFLAGGVFDTVVSLLFWFLMALLAIVVGAVGSAQPGSTR